MPTLYVTEQGVFVKKKGQRLLVERPGDGGIIGEIPVNKLDRVMLFGHIHVTSKTVQFLLREGIDTAFFTQGGRLLGRLVSESGGDVHVRIGQVRRFTNVRQATMIARAIVAAKIESSARVLRRIHRRHDVPELEAGARRLSELARDCRSATELDVVRGIEGSAAAIYFPLLGASLPTRWRFRTRSRRPPGDPPNAVLSFGYGVLLNEVAGVLTAVGLDPYLGCLHVAEYNRQSCALDLLEEFRAAIIDRLMLRLFNRGELDETSFDDGPNGGVWLSQAGRRVFLRAYESTMTQAFIPRDSNERMSFRKLLLRQARRLRDFASGESDEYVPYVAEP